MGARADAVGPLLLPRLLSAGARARLRVLRPRGLHQHVLLVVALGCALGPWLLPLDPETLNLDLRLAHPSLAHPMGTDAMGRDILARALHGGRLSLGVGVTAALLGVAFGALVGVAAGALGPRTDGGLMRGVDLALSVPAAFVALVLAARSDGDPLLLALTLAAFSWMTPARLVRDGVAPIRGSDYVAAARAAGATRGRIALIHLLPQVRRTLGAVFVLALAHAVLGEATLSFLGFGVRPPAASWGSLIAGARPYVASAPWIVVGPGLLLFATLWSVQRIGSGALPPAAAPTSPRPAARRRSG